MQRGVAVRRRLGDGLGGDISGGAAAIIHHPRLTERSVSLGVMMRESASAPPPGAKRYK